MTPAACKTNRHPELVSGSISRPAPSLPGAGWMLKQVQHDGCVAGAGRVRPAGSHPHCASAIIAQCVRQNRFKTKPDGQISPVRVRRFDQVDFPLTPPVLQLFFTGDCRDHVAVHFEPDQPGDAVLAGEAGQRALAVLPQSGLKIGRYANVQRSAWLAGKNVDARITLDRHGAEHAARWTLKQVLGDEQARGVSCR